MAGEVSVAEGEDPPHAGTAGTCVRCRARLCPCEEKLEFTCSCKQVHVKKSLCAPTGDGAERGRRAGAQGGRWPRPLGRGLLATLRSGDARTGGVKGPSPPSPLGWKLRSQTHQGLQGLESC